MAKQWDHVEFKALACFVCYFHYGDSEGLIDQEVKQIDQFLQELKDQFGIGHIDQDFDQFYSHCKITGSFGECLDYRYVFQKGGTTSDWLENGETCDHCGKWLDAYNEEGSI